MTSPPASSSARALLAGYDRRIDQLLREALASETGSRRVRSVHALRRVLAVHDSVLESALCPVLDELPGGAEVAARLRAGCAERAELLEQFQTLSVGTNARNVYPIFGQEIDDILTGLARSIEEHADAETAGVDDVLEGSRDSDAPDVVAAHMVLEAGDAPTRAHRATERHPRSRVTRRWYHYLDRLHDWNDAHHGWPGAERPAAAPVRPAPVVGEPPPSIPDLLAGYDRTVSALIDEYREAGGSLRDRAGAAYRLCAAITVHDSVLEGVLCHLLDAVAEGRPLAARLRAGCDERAERLEAWDALTDRVGADDLYRGDGAKVDAILEPLIASFSTHQAVETSEVAAMVERFRSRSWPWRGSGGEERIWVWPNPEPAVLAAAMAMWAEHAPTRPHHRTSNRLVRDLERRADQLRGRRRSRRGWPSLD